MGLRAGRARGLGGRSRRRRPDGCSLTGEPASSEALTRRWALAWAAARGAEVGELGGWPLVHVRSASRAVEVVCWEPDVEDTARLMRWLGEEPSRMLTVVSGFLAEPGAYVDLPPGVRVDRDDETLMRRCLAADRPRLVPVGLTLEVDRDGARVVVRLVDRDRVAAEGTVGVVGPDAAYDAVETTPRYRRRGLGSWVMAALDAHAVEAGARTGLLVATPAGASLYAGLGWEPVGTVWSLTGTAQ